MAIKKDKITAAGEAALGKLFSHTEIQDTESAQTTQKEKTEAKKVFSFRGNLSAVTTWRLYADAAGVKVDDFGSAAMEEYIKNHPLTEEQQIVYDIKRQQKKQIGR